MPNQFFTPRVNPNPTPQPEEIQERKQTLGALRGSIIEHMGDSPLKQSLQQKYGNTNQF